MITVNVKGNRIVGFIGEKPYSIPFKDEVYAGLVHQVDLLNRATNLTEYNGVLEIAFDFVVANGEEESTAIGNFVLRGNTMYFAIEGNVADVVVPPALKERILEAHSKELSVLPFEKFWVRLLRNPNIGKLYSPEEFTSAVCNYVFKQFVSQDLVDSFLEAGYSEQVAKEMATVYQTPITMEGLICTKKVVDLLPNTSIDMDVSELPHRQNPNWRPRDESGAFIKMSAEDLEAYKKQLDAEYIRSAAEDFEFEPAVMGTSGDAFRCGNEEDAPLGHIYCIGREARLDSWSQVDCNFDRQCVPGLHTGNQDYIRGWESMGTSRFTLNCFVDPSQIGAISAGEDVMRVKSLFPYSVKEPIATNRNIYHSSTYGKLKDEEFGRIAQEVALSYEEKAKQLMEQARLARLGIKLSR